MSDANTSLRNSSFDGITAASQKKNESSSSIQQSTSAPPVHSWASMSESFSEKSSSSSSEGLSAFLERHDLQSNDDLLTASEKIIRCCSENRLAAEAFRQGIEKYLLHFGIQNTFINTKDDELSLLRNSKTAPEISRTSNESFEIFPSHNQSKHDGVVQISAGRELTAEEIETIPRDEDGALTSIGSLAHESGSCKPCAFQHNPKKTDCANGIRCVFCHFKHPKRKKAPRPSKHQRILRKMLNAANKDESSIAEFESSDQPHELDQMSSLSVAQRNEFQGMNNFSEAKKEQDRVSQHKANLFELDDYGQFPLEGLISQLESPSAKAPLSPLLGQPIVTSREAMTYNNKMKVNCDSSSLFPQQTVDGSNQNRSLMYLLQGLNNANYANPMANDISVSGPAKFADGSDKNFYSFNLGGGVPQIDQNSDVASFYPYTPYRNFNYQNQQLLMQQPKTEALTPFQNQFSNYQGTFPGMESVQHVFQQPNLSGLANWPPGYNPTQDWRPDLFAGVQRSAGYPSYPNASSDLFFSPSLVLLAQGTTNQTVKPNYWDRMSCPPNFPPPPPPAPHENFHYSRHFDFHGNNLNKNMSGMGFVGGASLQFPDLVESLEQKRRHRRRNRKKGDNESNTKDTNANKSNTKDANANESSTKDGNANESNTKGVNDKDNNTKDTKEANDNDSNTKNASNKKNDKTT